MALWVIKMLFVNNIIHEGYCGGGVTNETSIIHVGWLS